MKAECPMGHTENLSYEELAERLENNDFECRKEECSKSIQYSVDSRFSDLYGLSLFPRSGLAESFAGNSLKEAYTTEPFDITDEIEGAPTMAGGIALIHKGRHIGHLNEDELEDMEQICRNALGK